MKLVELGADLNAEKIDRGMTNIHRATLRHAKGVAVCFGLLAGLAVVVPMLGGSHFLSALNCAAAILLAWRFKRMCLCFTDEALIYRGWLKKHEIPYSTIEKVFRPADVGWPRDRFYSHSLFEVVSQAEHIRINLLWFGSEASQAFRERILRVGAHAAS